MTPDPGTRNRGFLLVLSGPSGAGKDTVVAEVMRRLPIMERSVSCTTRAPREGEVNGRDYFFLSPAEFAAYRERGEFLEWAEVYGNLYGTPRTYVTERLRAGYVVLLVIDTQGAKTVMSQGTDDLVTVFITPSSGEILKNRLLERGSEAPIDLTQRLKSAPKELLDLHRFDYLVLNDSLDHAVAGLQSIVIAETYRVRRFRGDIDLSSDFAGRGG